MTARHLTLGTALGLLLTMPVTAQDTGTTESGTGAATASAETVVATVGDTDITLGHMVALRERLPEQYRQLPDTALFDSLLTQLVQQEALSQQAGETSQRTTLVLDNERRALRANAIMVETAEGAVTDEAVEAAYQEAYGDAAPSTEWNASHILLETEEAAAEVKAELDGGADFAEVARERSTGPTGPNGGALGWFGEDQMVPEFQQAVSELEPGEVSEPFETQFGWHVAKLNEVREQEPPALEEVRADLEQQVRMQAVEETIDAATANVEIERPDLSGIDRNVLSDSSLID